MSASEWREAAKAYANKFPDVANQSNFDLYDQTETKLIEFLISSDWKSAQAMLRAANRSIFLGRLSFNLQTTIEYYLDAHGLYHHCPCGGCSQFEAMPLDAVRSFYSHDQHKNLNMIDFIKGQLDLIALQTLKEANKGE